jgi:hypothetical protein
MSGSSAFPQASAIGKFPPFHLERNTRGKASRPLSQATFVVRASKPVLCPPRRGPGRAQVASRDVAALSPDDTVDAAVWLMRERVGVLMGFVRGDHAIERTRDRGTRGHQRRRTAPMSARPDRSQVGGDRLRLSRDRKIEGAFVGHIPCRASSSPQGWSWDDLCPRRRV